MPVGDTHGKVHIVDPLANAKKDPQHLVTGRVRGINANTVHLRPTIPDPGQYVPTHSVVGEEPTVTVSGVNRLRSSEQQAS